MRFKYCPDCGEKLIMKPIGDEGDVPFCERCSQDKSAGKCVAAAYTVQHIKGEQPAFKSVPIVPHKGL